MGEKEVGFVEHWWDHISVAGIKITEGKIKVGDTLHFKGHTTDFQEKIASIHMEHEQKAEAGKGDEIGIKVREKVRDHDKVFLVTD